MGKTVEPKGSSSSRTQLRTKQNCQEKDTGQRNITSFFSKDSASQLWTTISSAKKGNKKPLSLSKRKVTPGSKEKRGPVGEDTCREKNLDGPTISTVVTEGEQDKTVLSNGKCEKDPGVSSVSNVSRTESPVLTSNNLKDLSDECSADRDLKVSSDRNKKSSLVVQRVHSLRPRKQLLPPFASGSGSASENCDSPVKGTLSNASMVQIWEKPEIDSEDDCVPPTPPTTRFVNSQVRHVRPKRESPLSLKTGPEKPTVDTAVGEPTCLLIQSGDLDKLVCSDDQNIRKGRDMRSVSDDTDCPSVWSSQEDFSYKTSNCTRKAYKLSRKRNPRRVTSSPVKLKNDACGAEEGSTVGSTNTGTAATGVAAPSKLKLSRSTAMSVKRRANSGSSPAHKRQQTKAVDKGSAKCNLFVDVTHEVGVGLVRLDNANEEEDNAHLLEYYGVGGQVSPLISRQTDPGNCSMDKNREKVLCSERSADLDQKNSGTHDVEQERTSPDGEGLSGYHRQPNSDETTGVSENPASPRTEAATPQGTAAGSPSGLLSGDRRAIADMALISPVKVQRVCADDALNASRDSLMDVDFDVVELLQDVDWSPLPTRPNHQDKSSVKISPRALFSSAETGNNSPAPRTAGGRGYGRFRVLEVYRREITGPGAVGMRSPIEKVLRLFDEEKRADRLCYLREDWERTEVEPGDTVHITGSFDQATGVCVLDNKTEHYIVVHPDTLVSGTTVSMATRCLRRSILNERFRTESQNEAMLIGTLLHDLFDVAMTTQEFSTDQLVVQAKNLLRQHRYLNDLYSLGETELTALAKVQEHVPQLSSWAGRFVSASPHPDLGQMEFKSTSSQQKGDEQPSVCISQVKDIEENIWSPRFGLKGKVDATVEIKIDRRPRMTRHRAAGRKQIETAVLPLELKTGKMFSKLGSVEHRAQVILYTLLMSDRRRGSVDSGLLFYLKAAHMLAVPALLHEKRALVMRRNEVARFLALDKATGARAMPGMLRDRHTCSRCPQAQNCVNFHRAVENGDRATSGLGDQFDELTKHLSQSHIDYFADWIRLIYLEGKASAEKNRQREIWCLGGLEREKRGRCFGSMVLRSRGHESARADERTFLHVFERSAYHPRDVALPDVPITCGERVIVSEDCGGAVALASGFVREVREREVVVLLDKNLAERSEDKGSDDSPGLYRLDADEGYSALTTSLSNIAKLLKGDSETYVKLRRLIIDLEAPAFLRRRRKDISDYFTQTCSASTSSSQEMSSQCSFSSQAESILKELNSDQKNAVSKALSAQDYALILGMPGTGKTSTIACLVRVLVASGKSVLLTSYTHTAVDNILLKLKQAGLDFLRLGQQHKVLPELHMFTLHEAAKDVTTVNQLRQFYESKSIVATTCLGVGHALFQQRTFDFCIVDEASQITQPTCLGPLRHAHVFILVGDHYQLPPLVQSLEAREGGMDVSLFKRLSEHHPQSVVSLEHQYRMNSDIMELANALIYEDRLKCGTEGVATARLDMPRWDELSRLVRRQAPDSWLLHALDPSRPVVFLDTDQLPAPETRSDHLVSNEREALLVQQLTGAFLRGGVAATCIGVISPYRHQLKLITQMLRSLGQDIELNTVDKYQGRDKPCIVVSLVRSNDHAHVGDLLKDWRRVNVAVTRAKRKLVLIGSVKTLRGSLLLQELFDLLEARGWIHAIPKGAKCEFKLTEDSHPVLQEA